MATPESDNYKLFHFFSIWDVLPFISYIGFFFPFLLGAALGDYRFKIAFVATIVAFVVTYFCKIHENKLKPKSFTAPNKNVRNPTPFGIFSIVFGIVAALAISAPVESLLSDDCDSVGGDLCVRNDVGKIQDLSKIFLHKQFLVLSSFYAVGILFYHGCILALSGELSKLDRKNDVFVFLTSLLIFFEGMVLFMASALTDDIEQFSLWIVVLLVIDNIWVLANSSKNIETLPQWLHLNMIMILFLLALLFFPDESSKIGPFGINQSYWTLLFVFVLRTILDYKMGWNYWAKLDVEPN